MSSVDEKASLVHRAMLAYIGASGIPISVLLISLAKHAGWKPVLIGLPVYLIIAVLKSEVQHPDSYKVLRWKNNINSFSLKSG